MKVLVSGQLGYVGSSLVPELERRGHEVVGLDREDQQGLDIRYVHEGVLKGVDAVIHLAGFSQEPTAMINPRETDQTNHIATEKLAKYAKEAGIKKFVFASSCSVYFTYDTPLVPDMYLESDVVNPISPYSITKRSAELALLELADENFQPVIFRKGTIYGTSRNMRTDTVVNHFVEDVIKKGRMTVHAGGNIYRPLLDIKDAVWAYCVALEGNYSGIYNVATDNWNIGDLAKKVKSIIGGEVELQETGTTRNYQANTEKFQKDFNWIPQRKFEDAILELKEYYDKEQ